MLRIFHKFADRLFNYVVEGDPAMLSVCLLRAGLRLRPLSYMLYCYRAGRLREALQVYGKRTPCNHFEARILRRCQEMVAVLKNDCSLVEDKDSRQLWQFNGRVLLAFHSAASYNPSGYAIRSNAIMRTLAMQGISVSVCTRYGYPWDLLQHQEKLVVPHSQIGEFQVRHFHDSEELIGDADSLYTNAYSDRLVSLAKKEDASIIHASSNFLNGIAAAIAARKSGIRSVYEMRGLWHLSRSVFEPGFEETDHFQYCEKMEIAAAQACDLVVAISSPLKAWLIDKGIASKKIHIIPNAADTDGELIKTVEVPAGLKELSGKFIVGFIGSLTRYEGVDLIIQAIAELSSQIPDIHCLIVGDGRERTGLQSLARKLSCHDNVIFTGQVGHEQIAQYYNLIDVFPLPRKPYPVCNLVPPLKPFEIMAAGKPVIVSNLAPLVEIVKHEKTGLVCQSENVHDLAGAIFRLYNDRRLSEKIANNGYQWVLAKRTWKHNAKLYKQLYAEME